MCSCDKNFSDRKIEKVRKSATITNSAINWAKVWLRKGNRMEQTTNTTLERILNAYSVYYDMERFDGSEPLVAAGAFHEHGTGYMLVREAEMWSADSHEYVYFFCVPHLTKTLYEDCLRQARSLGEPRIDLSGSHMSTYITAVFLCDSAEAEAVAALKKCRIRKSFQFSLKGWMEVHTALIEMGKDSIIANSAGRNTAKFLKSVLYPKVKRGFVKRKNKGV